MIFCDCTMGCHKCGRDLYKELGTSPGELNMMLKPLKQPTATSVNVNMEMIVGSVEVDESGNKKFHRFAQFSTSDGHRILYPWEALKETVLQWIRIEEEGEGK